MHDPEKIYYLTLGLSGTSCRTVVDSLGEKVLGTTDDDYPERRVIFESSEVKAHLRWVISDTAELFGSDLAERFARHEAHVMVNVREGRQQKADQIGQIHKQPNPWVSLQVSPAVFQPLWEAAASGECPDLTLVAKEADGRFAVTEVRLEVRRTMHPVIAGFDERRRRFGRPIVAWGLGALVLIVIAIALGLWR